MELNKFLESYLNTIRVNEDGIDVDFTSRQGSINISHEKLVDALGSGLGASADGKTLDEWELEGFVDSEQVVATIYDWKSDCKSAQDITHWQIGGKSRKAIELIRLIFPHELNNHL